MEETGVPGANHRQTQVIGNFLTCTRCYLNPDRGEKQLAVSGNALDHTAIIWVHKSHVWLQGLYCGVREEVLFQLLHTHLLSCSPQRRCVCLEVCLYCQACATRTAVSLFSVRKKKSIRHWKGSEILYNWYISQAFNFSYFRALHDSPKITSFKINIDIVINL